MVRNARNLNLIKTPVYKMFKNFKQFTVILFGIYGYLSEIRVRQNSILKISKIHGKVGISDNLRIIYSELP